MAKKFNFKRLGRANKKFKDFNVNPRSQSHLDAIVTSKPKLQRTLNAIFSKKVATTVAVGAGVTTGAVIGSKMVWNYIEANSGCFRKRDNGKVCKVRELSCCQQDKLDNVNFCQKLDLFQNACDNYDEEQEKSCCRMCNCEDAGCEEGETLICQRPTVSDALVHYTENIGSGLLSTVTGLWSAITNIFTWMPYVVYAVVAILVLWLISLIYGYLPKKRNQDV